MERSVTIAGISSRELVAKDYATELNEEKVRKAAHYTAQKLAGSLALVTCKEPLKSNLGGHIRHFLGEQAFPEVSEHINHVLMGTNPNFVQPLIESVLPVLIQDNLDLACQAVEKAAMDRAVLDVDDGFAQSFELRRRHREVCYLSFPLR